MRSTVHLIHVLSDRGCMPAAKPKIADYPFTTLVPQLGVCEMGYRTTVFADIPGVPRPHLTPHAACMNASMRRASKCKLLLSSLRRFVQPKLRLLLARFVLGIVQSSSRNERPWS